MSRAEQLAKAREAQREAREKRLACAPRCEKPVTGPPVARLGRKGFVAKPTTRPCGTLMIQNEPERERGVYWCPSCQSYTRPEDRGGFNASQRRALRNMERRP